MLKKLLFLILFLCFYFVYPSRTTAAESSFITIVNPVRISAYVDNPLEGLSAEYEEVAKRSLPATWLLTFDVINDKKMVDVVKGFNKDQEVGIFLEVTSTFSERVGVAFNKRDSWHRATSLFLSGYKQEDRKKLIDGVFTKFKDNFGYYPKSVGSWWTDAYSLDYMSKKYGVIANLSVSDQFTLDGYQ